MLAGALQRKDIGKMLLAEGAAVAEILLAEGAAVAEILLVGAPWRRAIAKQMLAKVPRRGIGKQRQRKKPAQGA